MLRRAPTRQEIEGSILKFADELLANGFRVWIPKKTDTYPHVSFFFASFNNHGGYVQYNWLPGQWEYSVPHKPSLESGSSSRSGTSYTLNIVDMNRACYGESPDHYLKRFSFYQEYTG